MSSSHQRPRPCNDRTAARKWAVRYRPDKADWLILASSNRLASRSSRRRPPPWSPGLSPQPSGLRPPRSARSWPRRARPHGVEGAHRAPPPRRHADRLHCVAVVARGAGRAVPLAVVVGAVSCRVADEA